MIPSYIHRFTSIYRSVKPCVQRAEPVVKMKNLVDLGQSIIDGEPLAKRTKLCAAQQYSQYPPGSLIRIRMENFVTYELAEFNLSPSLNMIIGPNGSGKSSFVCAVCLGLAGKPEYIGRSKKVEDFIKNGEEQSKIEIVLRNSNRAREILGEAASTHETVTITRTIHREKKKSGYKIDGRSATELMVKQLTAIFNIQLDNLCQFLSQERVEDFSRLKADKLLDETARAIDPEILVVMRELRLLQESQFSTEKEYELTKARIEELLNKKSKLEDEVQSFRKFEESKKQLEIHTQLLPYVQILNHKEKVSSRKQEYKLAESQLKKFLKDKKPFADQQHRFESDIQDLDEKRLLCLELTRKRKQELDKIGDELTVIRDEVKSKHNQIKYYKRRNVSLRERIASVIAERDSYHKSLTEMSLPASSVFEELDNERNDLLNKESDLRNSIRVVDSKISSINHDIKQLESQERDLSSSLNNTDRINILNVSTDMAATKQAVLYIRGRKEMQGKVLEPPIMTISVKDPSYAKYLAQCVDYNTTRALTMVDDRAYEAFANEILERFAVNLRELSNAEITHPLPEEQIRELGFEGYVSDFVTGSPDIFRMLCQFSKINMIPISRKELSNSQLERLSKPGKNGKIIIQKFMHGNYVVEVGKSDYTNKVFSTHTSMNPRIINTPFYQDRVITNEQIESINNEISRRVAKRNDKKLDLNSELHYRAELKSELSTLSKKVEDLGRKTHSLNKIRKTYSQLETSIESLDSQLIQLKEESKRDVSQKINEVEYEICKDIKEQTLKIKAMSDKMGKLVSAQKGLTLSEIRLLECKNTYASMNDVMSFMKEKEEELILEVQEKEKSYRLVRDTEEYTSWKNTIKSYTNETKNVLAQYQEKYSSNNSFNLTNIQDRIEKLESELCMSNENESAIAVLAKTENELNTLQEKIPQLHSILQDTKSKITQKDSYLKPRLSDIVSNISAKFSKLFMNVGSAGDVTLEAPHLYSDWKIEINVKFRDNAVMKRLDSHTQSGGERAVSTVLYMIALQEFTTAPFRVVDEINQGMDPRNERIVHKAMVENACAENTSQYFLITPKLLTDLHYHEKMRVHCVMVGGGVPDPVKDASMLMLGQTANIAC